MYMVPVLFVSLVTYIFFGNSPSWYGALFFFVFGLIATTWWGMRFPKKSSSTNKTYSFHVSPSEPLSKEAREYLQKKAAQIAIKSAKEKPEFKDCSESDMKYMGIKTY